MSFADSYFYLRNDDMNVFVNLSRDNIAWDTDRDVRFRNPPDLNGSALTGTVMPPNWPYNLAGTCIVSMVPHCVSLHLHMYTMCMYNVLCWNVCVFGLLQCKYTCREKGHLYEHVGSGGKWNVQTTKRLPVTMQVPQCVCGEQHTLLRGIVVWVKATATHVHM